MSHNQVSEKFHVVFSKYSLTKVSLMVMFSPITHFVKNVFEFWVEA